MDHSNIPTGKASPSRFAKLGLSTSTITDMAADYAHSERLGSIFRAYKSGFVVASLWLTLHLRSWLGVLPLPIPSLATLPLVLLVLVSFSLSTPPRTLAGLAYYMHSQVADCCDLWGSQTYPDWLPRALLVVALLPLSRALSLLLVVAVWACTKSYRDGVAAVAAEADQVLGRATAAAAKAGEHVREAQTLEMQAMQAMQAMQLAARAGAGSPAVAASVRELKAEVEGLVADVGLSAPLEAMVDAVRQLAQRVREVAEEGDLALAAQMAKNTQELVERVVSVEETTRRKVGELKKKLWKLTLGSCSS